MTAPSAQQVLVTGGSGFVGSELVPLLLAHGYAVRVVTRSRASLSTKAWLPRVEVVEADLAAAEDCIRAVTGVAVVVHLAGMAHVGADEQQHRQQNFLNTQCLATAAQQAGVAHFVFISSCKARYPAHSAYGRYKLASENFLLALTGPMRVVCLRPGIIYGPGQRNNLRTLLATLARPWLPCFITSNRAIGMIGVEDCCRAVQAALEQPALAGRVWELADGERYSLQMLVQNVRSRLQLPLPLIMVSGRLAWPLFALAGLVPALRRRGLGLRTWRALFGEDYPPDLRFAQASGVWPSTTLYKIMPDLLAATAPSSQESV